MVDEQIKEQMQSGPADFVSDGGERVTEETLAAWQAERSAWWNVVLLGLIATGKEAEWEARLARIYAETPPMECGVTLYALEPEP